MNISILVALFLVGCTEQPADPRAPVAGDVLSVEWSTFGVSAPTRPDLNIATTATSVPCGEVVSHPCPFLIYTRRLEVGDGTITWSGATGATDDNRVPVETHLPVIEQLDVQDLSIILGNRGDDGGLRLDSKLKAVSGGFSGVVDYELFSVAGYTRFHVTLRFE